MLFIQLVVRNCVQAAALRIVLTLAHQITKRVSGKRVLVFFPERIAVLSAIIPVPVA